MEENYSFFLDVETHDLPNTNLEYVDREIAMIKVKLRAQSDEGPDLKKKDSAHCKFSIGDVLAFYQDDIPRVVIGYDLLCVPITVGAAFNVPKQSNRYKFSETDVRWRTRREHAPTVLLDNHAGWP